MRVAITGASGFIGREAANVLTNAGHEVVAAQRVRGSTLSWDAERGFEPPDALSGFDAVLHLAGENIANRRWTSARKKAILASRREGTRRVVEALERASPRPHTLLSASAIGYYGARAHEELTEEAPPGDDFLAETAKVWESEAEKAAILGVRVIRLRFGMVLDEEGGALAKMLVPFKLGLGGRLGDGEQEMSWIHRHDAARAIVHLLEHPECRGAFNLCAPAPVTNGEFTRALSQAVARPALIPLPGFAIKAALGEMAQFLLLSGQRVLPRALLQAGFEFRYPTLPAALQASLTDNRSRHHA